MLRFFAGFALLLFLPSAWFAWENRDMPNLGDYHDDGIYYTAAKSIAQSGSYRIESYPGVPYQTKYPPVLPLWHSIAWLIEPRFPENLPIAMFLQWIWLPVFAWLAWKLAEQWGFGPYQRWIIVAMVAINPYPLFFSTAILSEIPFGVMLAATMLLLGRGQVIPGAIVAGLAFLTRTAGVSILVTAPAVFLLQRKRREAALFFVTMLPFVAGWFLWSKMHEASSPDELTKYYVNYLGYHFRVFTLNDAHLFIWKNTDFLLQSAGAFLLPVVFRSLIAKITTQVLGVAAIVGALRLAKNKPEARQFGVFAAVSAVILILWSFPPNERFLLPMLPLLLAGYVTEFSRIGNAMRLSFGHKERSQRIAGYAVSAFFVGLIAFGVYTQLDIRYSMMSGVMQAERDRLAGSKPMLEWVKQNTAPDAKFVAAYDSTFYLYTGRRGSYHIANPLWWYRDEPQKAYQNTEAFARENGFNLIYWTPFDRRNDVEQTEQVEIGRKLANSPTLRLLKEFPNNFVFDVISLPPKTPEAHSQGHP